MTVDEITSLAKQFSEDKKKWHFHILPPDCQLHTSGKYTLVLENVTDTQSYEVHSDEPYMGVGKELVTLLHGTDVMKDTTVEKVSPPSPQVSIILTRAKELLKKRIFWHHHMLFPGCKYNKQKDKWVIIFEDKEKGEIIESVSDQEPKNDLQHIEGLFYSQKN